MGRRALSLGIAALAFAPVLGLGGSPAYAQAPNSLVVSGLPDLLGEDGPPAEFAVSVDTGGGGTLTFEAPAADDFLLLEYKLNGDWLALDLIDPNGDPVRDSVDVPDGDLAMRISYRSPEPFPIPVDNLSAGRAAGISANDRVSATNARAASTDPCDPASDPARTAAQFSVSLESSGSVIDSEDISVAVGHPRAVIAGLPAEITADGSLHPFTVTPCNRTDSSYQEVFLSFGIDADPSGEQEDARLVPDDVILEVLDESTGSWLPLGLDGIADVAVESDLIGPFELPARTDLAPVHFRLGFKASTQPDDALWPFFELFQPIDEHSVTFIGFDFAKKPLSVVAASGTPTPAPSSTPPVQGGPPHELPETGGNGTSMLVMALVGLVLVTLGGGAIVLSRRRAS
jgi:LPXTG-motif cell wall-anchored protein